VATEGTCGTFLAWDKSPRAGGDANEDEKTRDVNGNGKRYWGKTNAKKSRLFAYFIFLLVRLQRNQTLTSISFFFLQAYRVWIFYRNLVAIFLNIFVQILCSSNIFRLKLLVQNDRDMVYRPRQRTCIIYIYIYSYFSSMIWLIEAHYAH
jgi:hypothetical protein